MDPRTRNFNIFRGFFIISISMQGKFFEVSVSSSQIRKPRIHCYFLPERRVIQPPAGETNYQIFYSLLAGLSQEEMQKFGLAGKTAADFRCLGHKQKMLEEQEQKKKFADWKASLSILGITYQDIMQILIACILLGNVEFEDQGDYNVQICSSKDDLSKLCELLGLSVTSLVEGLTKGTSHYRGETIQCPLDIRQVRVIYNISYSASDLEMICVFWLP